GDDGRIKIWNVANGKLAKNLTGHHGAIRSLKFSGDNTLLASAAADKTLRVWGVPAGKPLAQARNDSSINAVTWLDDPPRIASGGADNSVRIWRFDAGKPELALIKELAGHEGPVTALDNITSADAQIISGSEDGSVRLWNLETGKVIREIKLGGPVAALAVRRDGK